MPATRPAASNTVNGSIEPAACSARRRSISRAMPSGAGTDVYHSRHSSPSRAAAHSASWCSCASGRSVACGPCSTSGSGQGISGRAFA
jgi:hypothetical protein